MNAAADRVFDGEHAVSGRPGGDGGEDFLEAPAREEIGLGVDAPRRRLAEGAQLALIGNPHTQLQRIPGLEVELIIFT